MQTQLQWKRLLLIGAGVVLLALLVSACGGSHGLASAGDSDSAGSPAVKGKGSLALRVIWPEPSKEISDASNSIVVIVTNADGSQELGRKVLVRDGGQEQGATIADLPAGPVSINAAGFPTADATGVAQTRGTVGVTIVADQTVNAPPLTMATTITKMEVTDDTGGDRPVPGQLVTFTATAYDAANHVVMIPEPTSTTWTVTNGAELVDTTGASTRAVTAVDKYTLTVLTLGSGELSVQVQATGAGQGTTAVKDIEIDPVLFVPPGGGAGTQITDQWIDTFDGHVGFGYDDKTVAVHGSSPFVSSFTPQRITVGNPVVDTEIGWDFDHRYSERGTHFDMSLQAKYKNASGGVTAAYDSARSSDATSISFTVTNYEDWGSYELDPQELNLTRQAASLLRQPQNFLAQYGHRLIIGERRRNFVTARYTVAKLTRTESEDLNLTWNASYNAAVWSAATKGNYTSKLREIAEHTSVDVAITTNATGAAATISDIITSADDVDRVLGVIADLMTKLPDESGAVAYEFVTTPMTDVLPALNQGGAILPFLPENKLAQEFLLWDQYNRAFANLWKITHDVNEDYTWLPASNLQALQSQQDDVEQTIVDFEDRLKKLIDDPDSVPTLPPSMRQPPTILGWPNPWIRVDTCDIRRFRQGVPDDVRTNVNVDLTVGGVGDISPVALIRALYTNDPVFGAPGVFNGVRQPDGTWRWHYRGDILGPSPPNDTDPIGTLCWASSVPFTIRDTRGKTIIATDLPTHFWQ